MFPNEFNPSDDYCLCACCWGGWSLRGCRSASRMEHAHGFFVCNFHPPLVILLFTCPGVKITLFCCCYLVGFNKPASKGGGVLCGGFLNASFLPLQCSSSALSLIWTNLSHCSKTPFHPKALANCLACLPCLPKIEGAPLGINNDTMSDPFHSKEKVCHQCFI